MAVWDEIAAKLLGLGQRLASIDDKFKRQEDDIKALVAENAKLRDALHAVDLRLTRLEESRSTDDARLDAALTRTITAIQLENAKRETQTAKDALDRLNKRLPGGEQ